MTPAPQPSGALGIGLETHALAVALGVQPDQAAAAAISDAARAHETAVLHRISRAAELVAASLLTEPSGRYRSHAAAITRFTDNHVVGLPALVDADQYQPAPGDVIEVTLTGTVLAADSAGTWTLADTTTGRQYQFARPGRDGAPRLRVLDAAHPSSPPAATIPRQNRRSSPRTRPVPLRSGFAGRDLLAQGQVSPQ